MSEKKKMILGLVGEIASGKDTMAAYLKKKYNSETLSFSTPLRDILDILHIPQARENIANLGYDLRQRFGQDLLDGVITKKIQESDGKLFTLPNVRLELDIENMKKVPGFELILIRIDADPKVRYQRLIYRGQNTDDNDKTWEQFLKDSELATEITIREVAKKAQYQLDNNGSYENFYKQIDELMKKIYV